MPEDEEVLPQEWLYSREAAELVGIPQSNFLYYAKNGDVSSKPGGKQGKLYSRADVMRIRRQIAAKNKKAAPEKPLIDWALAADVPAALKLSMQVYPAEEVDLREAAIYQAWRKNNNCLTMAAFSPDRAECYATIQVIPLVSEQIILDVLSGKRDDNSIHPDEIPAYNQPGPYNLLVASATCLPTRPALLYQVLRKYMNFWVDQYPERWIKRVYAQAATDAGMRIVQHFFMSTRLDLAHNAFMLDLAYPPAARMIKEFKSHLAEKAPLPPDLQWPPVP